MEKFDQVISNVLIVDGTGHPGYTGDVAINADKIVKIAESRALDGKVRHDGTGKLLTPGFVDIHSHADFTLLADGRAHSSTMQGVTSIVPGNCGHGIAPVNKTSADLVHMNISGWLTKCDINCSWQSFGDYLNLMRDRGVSTNVFPLVSHGALRLMVAGYRHRSLLDSEISHLQKHLEQSMAEGACGLSTGLEYLPGLAADTDELCRVAEGMKDFNGFHATHCRNRTDKMREAADEAVRIAKAGQARLQMSHFVRRPSAPSDAGTRSWEVLDAAEREGIIVHADVIPFEFGPTPLAVMLPSSYRNLTRDEVAEHLNREGSFEDILANLGPMFEGAIASGAIDEMYVACDGGDGAYVGKTLREVAHEMKCSLPEAAFYLLRRAGRDFYSVTIIERWVDDADLRQALCDPRFFIMGDGATGCLDGPLRDFNMTMSDWGFAPHFLGHFVRDQRIVTLEDAVHRMTLGPARQIGLTDRGAIKVGMKADLALMDYSELGSGITPSELKVLPSGVTDVWVNGDKVVRDSMPTDARPGSVGLSR
jgi:N-acyl-D-aspartate/D-glutamate deacylase